MLDLEVNLELFVVSVWKVEVILHRKASLNTAVSFPVRTTRLSMGQHRNNIENTRGVLENVSVGNKGKQIVVV